jgi:hypothetical protein
MFKSECLLFASSIGIGDSGGTLGDTHQHLGALSALSSLLA